MAPSSSELFTPAPDTWGALFDHYYEDLYQLSYDIVRDNWSNARVYELEGPSTGHVAGLPDDDHLTIRDDAHTLIALFFARRVAAGTGDWRRTPVGDGGNLPRRIAFLLHDTLLQGQVRTARLRTRWPREFLFTDLDDGTVRQALAQPAPRVPNPARWVQGAFGLLSYDQLAAIQLLAEGLPISRLSTQLRTTPRRARELVSTAREVILAHANDEGIHLRVRRDRRTPQRESKMERSGSSRYGYEEHRLAFSLRYDGGLAARGEVPAVELARALEGWDRLLHLTMHAQALGRLEPIPQGAARISDLRIQRAGKGSFLVEAVLFIGGAAAAGIIGNSAYELAKRGWPWTAAMLRSQVDLRQRHVTEDDAIDEIERLAREHNLRVTRNRENSERYLASVSSSLADATAPLQSSAVDVRAELAQMDAPITITRADRDSLMIPYAPPTVDPGDEGLVTAAVKFIRINKRTGNGSMEFLAPKDPSQLGVQRFRCIDPMIRRRANRYTGAFHLDSPMVVQMQRKGYEHGRKGHYWLIAGLAEEQSSDSPGLFGQFDE